jgi:hypothetical protein
MELQNDRSDEKLNESCATTLHTAERCATTVPNATVVLQLKKAKDRGIHRIKIGKIKRTTKGTQYTSPRILLPSDLQNLVGQSCIFLDCDGDVQTKVLNCKNAKLLIFIIPEQYR